MKKVHHLSLVLCLILSSNASSAFAAWKPALDSTKPTSTFLAPRKCDFRLRVSSNDAFYGARVIYFNAGEIANYTPPATTTYPATQVLTFPVGYAHLGSLATAGALSGEEFNRIQNIYLSTQDAPFDLHIVVILTKGQNPNFYLSFPNRGSVSESDSSPLDVANLLIEKSC